MSEKYFIRYFKQALGVTPGQYMIQLRMNRARDLVYTQRYSMQQVASLLGYPDAYSFSKAFKKHYKVPPSKFV
jgi:AraC family transcriptional regulator